ncbi:hypothetical protein SAMN06297280_0652 [Arsukibacterium tuosuense]|uniref:Uncharacterized protein n=1 Tax=Arsukibacterium tuosuense TaxID=1323745 RepID=A0A285I729_9GAMM|nr:hypothetical protein SAMN06297280_0652 [Arsukibacterium tuosuense]
MFIEQEQQIKKLLDAKFFSIAFWSALKISVAVFLIIYFDFGLYVVIGYIIYALESSIHSKHINDQQIDLQLNIIHRKLDELSKK